MRAIGKLLSRKCSANYFRTTACRKISSKKSFQNVIRNCTSIDSIRGITKDKPMTFADCCFCVWWLAKLRKQNSEEFGIQKHTWLKVIIDSAVNGSNEYNPRTLSQLIWSFAKLNVSDQNQLDKICNALVLRANELNAQDITNVLWACATLGFKHRALLGVLKPRMRDLLKNENFNHLGLTNTAWALAKLDEKHYNIFQEIGARAILCITEFTPQGLATLAWAFASVEVNIDKLNDHAK
jgi:hypothetical protein